MSTERVLRNALYGVALALCVGTPAELALTEHWESPPQLIPFVLSAVGLVALGAAWAAPRKATVLGARVAMGLLALGGAFGMFEHLEHNAEFYAEIQPEAAGSEVWMAAFTGANPLLAPGIFLVVAALGAAATYRAVSDTSPSSGTT